ncbi:hypothetical protein DFP72DRAFT_1092494 [Ephemerocybe angulata]|uniref:Uncharacterized protein n=1 Tax=Ephemerocybe angulata TaxID=980116 RepID=A0A8H6IBV2_9AGAR|nr:hypothetical protein DFP72DRAFT_1092494 [Tulosesus angulatus]
MRRSGNTRQRKSSAHHPLQASNVMPQCRDWTHRSVGCVHVERPNSRTNKRESFQNPQRQEDGTASKTVGTKSTRPTNNTNNKIAEKKSKTKASIQPHQKGIPEQAPKPTIRHKSRERTSGRKVATPEYQTNGTRKRERRCIAQYRSNSKRYSPDLGVVRDAIVGRRIHPSEPPPRRPSASRSLGPTERSVAFVHAQGRARGYNGADKGRLELEEGGDSQDGPRTTEGRRVLETKQGAHHVPTSHFKHPSRPPSPAMPNIRPTEHLRKMESEVVEGRAEDVDSSTKTVIPRMEPGSFAESSVALWRAELTIFRERTSTMAVENNKRRSGWKRRLIA